MLLDDSFDEGTGNWRHSHRVRVTQAGTGVDDGRAMRLTAGFGATVGAGIRLPRKDTPAHRNYRARAVMRVRTPGTVVGIRIREILNGELVARSTQKARIRPGTWRTLAVKHRKRRAASSLRVKVFAVRLRTGRPLVVDDVRVRRGKPPASSTGRECAISDRGIPSCGAFFGASVGLNGDPSALEDVGPGQPLALHRTFYQASQVDRAVTTARHDLREGRLPWISFKLPHGWRAMARGRGDAWARTIADRLATLPGPVWVAFHHEPELDGPIHQWTRLQERLAPIVRRRAPNVAYTVILTGWHQFYGETEAYSLDRIVPSTKVDVLGFDLYNRFGTPGSNRTSNADLRAEYFERISRWAAQHDIAWAIGEIGYTDRAFAADRRWLLKTYRDMVATGGVAMSYFNSAPASATGDWLLDTRPRRAAFAEVQQESLRLQ